MTYDARRSPDQMLDILAGQGTGELRHVRRRPAREAVTAPWPDSVPALVRSTFEGTGIHELWSHQSEAIARVMAGEHVVVATGTASGKSLAYQVPMLSAATGALDPATPSMFASLRGATSLYLSPTKALAADQRTRLEALAVPGAQRQTATRRIGHGSGRDEPFRPAQSQRREFPRDRRRQPRHAAGIRASTMPAYQLDPKGIASSSKL